MMRLQYYWFVQKWKKILNVKANLCPITRERFKEMVYFEEECVHIDTLFGMTKQRSMVLLYAVPRSFKSPFRTAGAI